LIWGNRQTQEKDSCKTGESCQRCCKTVLCNPVKAVVRQVNPVKAVPAMGAVAGARPEVEGDGAGTVAELGWGRTGSCCSFLPEEAAGAVAGASPEGDGAGAETLLGVGRTGSCWSLLPPVAEGAVAGARPEVEGAGAGTGTLLG